MFIMTYLKSSEMMQKSIINDFTMIEDGRNFIRK